MPNPVNPTPTDFFQLPCVGADPFFGFSRAWWKNCEREGHIKFRRTKKPGHRASRVEIPYAAAKSMIEGFQKTD